MRGALFAGGGLLFTGPSLGASATTFSAEEISEFVSAAHSDLDKTKKILAKKPLILNCADQMVLGDFETALGGASHMGRKDIGEYLFSQGARLDIFNLILLGYTSFVKQLITQFPDYIQAYGPHGYTLLHHAKVAKQTRFAEWLRKNGLEKEIDDGLFDWG